MPQTDAERAQVMEQLEHLVAHVSFLNSKRYPKLLRFVVEQSLAGNDDRLKERWLGMEVFERAPDYDTNQDPVVRLSAGEVRKRLALYYQQPEHRDELVIGLHPGSYVPYFQPASASDAPAEAAASDVDDAVEDAVNGVRIHKGLLWGAVGLAFAVALTLCWRIVEDPARIFWEPLVSSPNRVTLCAGAPNSFLAAHGIASAPGDGTLQMRLANGANAQQNTVGEMMSRAGKVSLAHVSALIHIGALLETHHKAFRVQLDLEAAFPGLREGPVVLIGAGDNVWTMRLTAPLRYGFAYNEQERTYWIADRKNPAEHNWSIAMDQPYSSLSKDYAVIARYHDATIDQPVVIVAGLSSEGTEAASEFLERSESLRTLLHDAPRAAEKVNLEAVIETQIIDGHAGPSHVVAIEYW
jgi:hypothetical protein